MLNYSFDCGFLGLDNIGVFDRSSSLPTGGNVEQADDTDDRKAQQQDPRPLSERSLFIAPSIFFRDEPPVRNRGNVVVGVLLGSLGQFHLFVPYSLVGNEAEEMRDEVQACAPLVVGMYDATARVRRPWPPTSDPER